MKNANLCETRCNHGSYKAQPLEACSLTLHTEGCLFTEKCLPILKLHTTVGQRMHPIQSRLREKICDKHDNNPAGECHSPSKPWEIQILDIFLEHYTLL